MEVLLAALGAGLAFAAQVSDSFGWVHEAGFALLIAGFLIEPLLVFGHELGHAFAARTVGVEVVHVRLGHGSPGLRFRFAGFDIEWSRQPYTGVCDLGVDSITSRQLGIIAAAGPVASLVIAAVLGFIAPWAHDGSAVLYYTIVLAAGSSAFIGIGNAIPVRRLPAWWPGAAATEDDEGPSDGYLVLHALRRMPADVAPVHDERDRWMTARVRDAFIAADRLAKDGHMGTEHLLRGLLAASGPAAGILRGCGITEWSRADERGPETGAPATLTPAVMRALHRAHAAMTLRGDPRIDAEHLLLGIVEEPDSEATKTLVRLGVDPVNVRQATLSYLRAA